MHVEGHFGLVNKQEGDEKGIEDLQSSAVHMATCHRRNYKRLGHIRLHVHIPRTRANDWLSVLQPISFLCQKVHLQRTQLGFTGLYPLQNWS